MILVCINAFSKFVWLTTVREASTSATIKKLRDRVLSTFSVPEILVSDNSRCLTSAKFQQFCFDFGINHLTQNASIET